MRLFVPATQRALIGVLVSVMMGAAGLATGSAQETDVEFVMRSWGRRDGLPPVPITDVQRGADGYLWFVTPRGLFRFDGARFKVFNDQNTPVLRTNRVSCLLAESGKGLWIGTAAGLKYSPEGGFGDNRTAVGIVTQAPVNAVARDTSGGVWAQMGSNELVRIVGGKVESRYQIPGQERIRHIVADSKGSIVAVTRNELYTQKDGRFVGRSAATNAEITFDVVATRPEGGLWVASGRAVSRLDRSGEMTGLDMSENDAPQDPIMALMEDQTGRLWVGTRNGSVHYFRGETGWRQVTPRRSRSLGAISCLYEDQEGSIWAATAAGILHQIKPRLFTTWSLPSSAQESVTQCVCVRRDGTVWIGTDGAGAYRSSDGIFAHFGPEQGLTNATVVALFEDRQTNLWAGTLGGLFRFDNQAFAPELDSVVAGHSVAALFQDRQDNLWFGTVGALIRKRGEEVKVYSLGEGFEQAEVRAIAEGPRGELWIGTRGGGLFRMQNGRIERQKRFSRPVVNTMYCDRKGVLWIGTGARGLYRYANGNVRSWTTADGLPSNMIFALLEDGQGTLWISSNEGVFGVRKEALASYGRGRAAPLLTIQLAASNIENWSAGSGQPTAAVAPNGRFWFPLGHGVLSFTPSVLMRSRPDLPVLIEEVLVDGAERLLNQNNAAEGPSLRLSSGARRLEFRYTIADLDAPGRLEFRYKLEGYDEDWINAGYQRSVHYGRLQPGTYKFRVISAGSGNLWKETARPLTVTIVPRVWETGWFRTSTALLVIGAIGATVHFVGRSRMRRKLERLEMQQAMEKERRRIAQDLHDDLGAGLTEIMLLGELGKRNSATEAQAQIATIAEKARSLATAMDEVVWTVNPENDVLPNLASYICDYAREFLRAASVSCRIDMMDGLPSVPVTAPQRHNLFMAVKEALNNAAKHSGAGEVWLRIAWGGDRLTVSVEDNGRGFDAAQARENGSGNGLFNMQARMGNISGKTELTSQPEHGTKVRFILPLNSGAPTESII